MKKRDSFRFCIKDAKTLKRPYVARNF